MALPLAHSTVQSDETQWVWGASLSSEIWSLKLRIAALVLGCRGQTVCNTTRVAMYVLSCLEPGALR